MRIIRPLLWIASSLALVATTLAPASAADLNRAPISYLGGANTLLGSQWGLSVDGAGSRYVPTGAGKAIVVHAAGATGNAAPTRVIQGASTLLSSPRAVCVDGTGRIYVADTGASAVLVFDPGANGDRDGDRRADLWAAGTGLHRHADAASDRDRDRNGH